MKNESSLRVNKFGGQGRQSRRTVTQNADKQRRPSQPKQRKSVSPSKQAKILFNQVSNDSPFKKATPRNAASDEDNLSDQGLTGTQPPHGISFISALPSQTPDNSFMYAPNPSRSGLVFQKSSETTNQTIETDHDRNRR